jgi:hypothetical protein
MAHQLNITLIDSTDDFAVLKVWHAKGWRIKSIAGDEYLATKTIKVPV